MSWDTIFDHQVYLQAHEPGPGMQTIHIEAGYL